MTSSPYLAIKCLKETALLAAQDYPCGSKTILNDFYVDDLQVQTNELSQLRQEVVHILATAIFEL